MWAGRLRQEGENGFAVLGQAKRSGCQGQAQRKGHRRSSAATRSSCGTSRQRARWQVDLETSWCNDGFCFSQLSCSNGSVFCCRILEFPSTLGCECCSGKAHVCYRLDDHGMGHEQAEEGLVETCEKSRGRSERTSCKSSPPKRGETRPLPTLSRASVLPPVGCGPVLCGSLGWSSMRPCSVQKYQCSRLRLTRFSVCQRVPNWEVIEPSQDLPLQGKGHARVSGPSVGDVS